MCSQRLLPGPGAASHAKSESWPSSEPSGWQLLLLAAAFPELGGASKNCKNPFALSSLLEPELQIQTPQPSTQRYQQLSPSPNPARQVTGTGSSPSKHSLQGAVIQPQAWNGYNLPRTLPRRKAAQCGVCSRCQEEKSLDTSRQLSQENKLLALSASPPATRFLLLLLLPPPCPWQRCPTATLSLLGGRTGTPGAVLTNAVTQGSPVEARLAAHDTTVGAQAVLAPPRATDGIPVLFTLIHICREESKKSNGQMGTLLAHCSTWVKLSWPEARSHC